MEVLHSSETLANFYYITQCRNANDNPIFIMIYLITLSAAQNTEEYYDK
jgi:hypothetical protein